MKSEANVEISKISNSKSPIYIQIGSEKTKTRLTNLNFVAKIAAMNYNIVDEYDLESNRADNTVRYFNNSDKESAEKLCIDIQKQFSDINLKPIYIKLPKIKVPEGQLEIWIK